MLRSVVYPGWSKSRGFIISAAAIAVGGKLVLSVNLVALQSDDYPLPWRVMMHQVEQSSAPSALFVGKVRCAPENTPSFSFVFVVHTMDAMSGAMQLSRG